MNQIYKNIQDGLKGEGGPAFTPKAKDLYTYISI